MTPTSKSSSWSRTLIGALCAVVVPGAAVAALTWDNYKTAFSGKISAADFTNNFNTIKTNVTSLESQVDSLKAFKNKVSETKVASVSLSPGQIAWVGGDLCQSGTVVISGDCFGGGDGGNDGATLITAGKDNGPAGGGRRWVCYYRNSTGATLQVGSLTRCMVE